MTQYFNQSDDKRRRPGSRVAVHAPKAEVMLWSVLKGRKMLGCKFRRQFGVGAYRIDFYCAELLLGIELDGETHYVGDAQVDDRKRQAFIESLGVHVLRFLNDDVYTNLDGVWEAIARAVRERMARIAPGVPRGRRARRRERNPISKAAPYLPPP